MERRAPLQRRTPMPRGQAQLRRTELARGDSQLQRGGRLPARSARRTAELPARDAVRAEVIRRDRTCTAAALVPSVACGGPLDVHEVIPRSAWPAGYLVVANCRLICRRHHDWIGANPDAAHALGLHGYSWERPDRRPRCP